MSGICAVWRKGNPAYLSRTLSSVAAGLSVRPEESVTQHSAGGAGVAIARRFETQQIYQNSRLLIACDADLYNSDALRELVEFTEPVPEESQTAGLCAALYERFGCDFLEKLEGAFSLVLWDTGKRQLLAAIDGFGINRLVYGQTAQGLTVASRISSLMGGGDLDTEINPRSIANILNFSSNLAPETIFKKVERLPPGTVLITCDGEVRLRKFWDMAYGIGADSNENRLSGELESVVERSVAVHCKRDAFSSLGAFLSGGTDSSTVVGLMSRMKKGPVKAFSIGFEEQPFNELGYAEIAAKKFHAEHYTYLVGPRDCYEALPHMIRYFDEPFGNSSAIATYFCSRLAAQNGVKILLAGDGGDELFGGNERYAIDKIFEAYRRVPGILRKGLIEPALAVLPIKGGVAGRARGYIRRANLSPIDRYLSYQFLKTNSAADVFEGDFLKSLGIYSIVDIPADHYSKANARDHLDRLLYVDMKITLADNDLPKVTCMSELAGIQARFPFLHRPVAEFSGQVPAGLKVKGTQKRYLFKRAFRNLLPAEIIQKKKHGFGIPVATWMNSDPRMRELSRDVLLSTRAFQRGYFKRRFVEDLFEKHERDGSTPYYGDMLWTFLTLELWHRQAVDEPANVPA
jgi:asparagine synthase (glutamine-hydrolysing)